MHILFLELQIPKKDWNATNSRTATVLSLFHTYFILFSVGFYSQYIVWIHNMRLIHSEEVQLGHGKGCRGVDVQIKGANDENGKACEDHVVPTLMEQQLWVIG